MSSALEKALSVLEYMVLRPNGVAVSDIANSLDLPVSGVHRLLKELERNQYVRQTRNQGDYKLCLKLVAMGLSYLGHSGISNLCQPILDRLAEKSGELIRLSLPDGYGLVWVAAAQGVSGGLYYDAAAEMGQAVHLASTSTGQAWLAAQDDEEVLRLVSLQGISPSGNSAGENAPENLQALLAILRQVRDAGYAMTSDSFISGVAAIATTIRQPETGKLVGTISIAGPAVRLTHSEMLNLKDELLLAAEELAIASLAAPHFAPELGSANLRRIA